MSTSYSSSSTPEFTAESGYSDMLNTATPPRTPKSTIGADSPDLPTPSTPTVEPSTVSISSQKVATQHCERGRKSLAAKDYGQAKSAYKTAIEWNPESAFAHSGLAQVYYQIQDYDNALAELGLAIQIDRTQIDFYYQRALVSKVVKNYYQVLADCKRIFQQDPNHASARWLNAVALVKTENYQIALSDLDRHIDTYPQDHNGYCYRGICYERLEQFTLALADFDRAIEIKPRRPIFHHARGRTRQKLGDLSGALADLNLAIDLKPQAAIYDDRAELHRCLGNHPEALQDCDKAIELTPNLISAHFRKGLTYTDLGNLELALVSYSQTIDLDPEDLNAYIHRSWTYFRQEEYQRAKRDCQTAISLDRACFWANYILGVVNNFLGLKNNAITNFTKAIEIFPNYVSARYHRGVLYHESGDIAKAKIDFEEARSIQDKGLERLIDRDETGFYAEGMARYYMDQPESALNTLRLGSLAAKRFNNPSFHKLIQSTIESLGLVSGDLMPKSKIN